jgi:hypothetical protein
VLFVVFASVVDVAGFVGDMDDIDVLFVWLEELGLEIIEFEMHLP